MRQDITPNTKGVGSLLCEITRNVGVTFLLTDFFKCLNDVLVAAIHSELSGEGLETIGIAG